MNKQSIAVYNPSDPTEKALQDACHANTGEWMPSFVCQLAAKAVKSLKIFDDDWLDPFLLSHRMSYFFSPHMASRQEQLVFVTHPLFFRDILENREINSYLYSPIVLMTRPLAHYLFQEYPIHLHVSFDAMKALNYKTKFVHAGGLVVVEDENLQIDDSAITGIFVKESHKFDGVEDMIDDVQRQTPYKKVAITSLGLGLFKSDDDERSILPDGQVWDKITRTTGRIMSSEPGETGMIEIQYDNGSCTKIPKVEFDLRFSRV